MKIKYIPSVSGTNYMQQKPDVATLDVQTLETQGLLSQLALHAGIHVEIPPYSVRLANYHKALMQYDAAYPSNMYHRSIVIDSMSVAKTLLGWRDYLRLAGWNRHKPISARIDALSDIETYFQADETGLPMLLSKVVASLKQMSSGELPTPSAYRSLEVDVLCPKQMLPDYIIPLFDLLEPIASTITYQTVDTKAMPKAMEIIEFTQQFKAEAWLSQTDGNAYDVWLNADNKRLDNWLHLSGQPVAGSQMLQSNPQVTQMFLLAIQLFQRPLNVNTLLQYLYLPECPLPWMLTTRLASTIVSEGGFTSSKVLKSINEYLQSEYKKEGDTTPCKHTPEERSNLYRTYLPFDLLDPNIADNIANEQPNVDVKQLTKFLKEIQKHASRRAGMIAAENPYDLKIEQLLEVSTLIDALLVMLDGTTETIPFAELLQWAQSLYDPSDYCQYNAQVGSRFVVRHPANLVSIAPRVIWCDFYGDVSSTLTTDFLSPLEVQTMQQQGILLWDPAHEKAYRNFILSMPLHQTSDQLTFVVCRQRGTTEIPTHPLRLQLPKDVPVVDGDHLFDSLPATEVQRVDNHRDADAEMVTFDAEHHPVSWRQEESYSALEKLLQNPLDYFMNYTLGFSDKGPTEIKMSLTNGNVAHETIEDLFTAERGKTTLKDYVTQAYDAAFARALANKGALLLLPEHHLDCDKLRHQLRRCVLNLAEIIQANKLKVEVCEQEEHQSLGFAEGIAMTGYIDMLLTDTNGNDVVFDLKWTSKTEKYVNRIKNNRDAQLAIYQAMLQQHDDHPSAARTAFFVMPEGNILSSDDFAPCHFEQIKRTEAADIMDMLRKGYTERRDEISAGKIETADLVPFKEIHYAGVPGIFPLEAEGTKNPKKAENKYSDYKCFTL